MQYTLRYSRQFKRQYKKLERSGRPGLAGKLDAIMNILASGQTLPARCLNHRLAGQLNGLWECHVAPDWLLIYRLHQDVLVLEFFATGTHTQLFD
ncbi:MAG: type II toxin-antitoxin system YafQ family toxin [Candidatus Magasanikbacteria bacterium]|nr:type II toxin-antitoxin system YafQ family toxin [Candidatus Magasanikbacteria bacterium]